MTQDMKWLMLWYSLLGCHCLQAVQLLLVALRDGILAACPHLSPALMGSSAALKGIMHASMGSSLAVIGTLPPLMG